MLDLPRLLLVPTREHYLLLVGAAGVVAMLTGAVSAWLGAYFGGRVAARRLREAQSIQFERSTAEIAALRQAVDVVAVEVERLAEGQRFTARLLAERAEARPLPPLGARPSPGTITPH